MPPTGISPATIAQRGTKKFKVVSKSKNRNSFGLQGHVLMARDGEAWECGVSHINERQIGDVIDLPYDTQPIFITLNWSAEIPHKLVAAPKNVADLVWQEGWKG